MQKFVHLFSWFLCLCCSVGNTNSNGELINKTKEIISNELNQKEKDTNGTFNLLSEKEVKIVSMQKELDINSKWYSRYSAKCEEWVLDEEKLIEALKSSEHINGTQHHYDFLQLPCYYKGIIYLPEDEDSISFTANSGSYFYLYYQDTTIILGYYLDNGYFIFPGSKD